MIDTTQHCVHIAFEEEPNEQDTFY